MAAKIAIVEDDEPIASMYKMKLETEGYAVKYVLDGEKGYDLVQSFQPDLLLLDILLPGMNGDVLLQKLRSTDGNKKMKVIILTNISQDEASPNLKQLDVARYVVKAQNTPSQVLAIVKEVLNA